jgi:Flp pilus assembly protein TadG
MVFRPLRGRLKQLTRSDKGAAAVEFAIVLPILVIMLLGIIDFGLYFYNDLQITHATRNAARYLSVGDVADANAAILSTHLISTSLGGASMSPATTGNPTTVSVQATYSFLTPLPVFVGMGKTLPINATVVMRRE